MRQNTRSHSVSDAASLFVHGRLVVLWVVVAFLAGVSGVQAQYEPSQIQEPSSAMQAKAGIQLLQSDRVEEAISLLRDAVEADSSLLVPEQGAASYWLGEAHMRSEDPATARSTWRSGMHALRAEDRFDVRLADVYLQNLTPEQLRGERLHAVDVYQTLLSRVTPDTSSDLRSLFRRRVAQIAPLMPDDVFARVVEEDRSTEASEWTFRAEAGTALQEWWRGLDPLVDTEENERLEEHLGRLVHVQQEYECSDRTSALDERGIIHLRFGEPYKQREIDYENGEFFREVFRFGVHVSMSDFPQSEIWLYPQIDESGYYLFAEDGTSGCYQITEANDLIPNHLTMRRGDTERGLNIAYSALMAMEAIYRELALYHIDYSGRYSEIANYADLQEIKATEARIAERMGGEPQSGGGEQQVKVGAGIGQTRYVYANPMLGIDFPSQFVPRMVSRAEREDAVATRRRKEAMPRQHTTLLDGAAHLPVAVRTARFLTDDGKTQTEVYWGIPRSALALEAEDDEEMPPPSLLTLSAVRYDANRESQQRVQRRYQIASRPGSDQQVLVPPSVTLDGTSELSHLGLQWAQYEVWATDSSDGASGLRQKRRLATARADSLQPLRADGSRVEMSDVKVLSLPDTTTQATDHLAARATPYPFRTIAAETPLLLSFEVYHLTFGTDDRTRYTVAYEAEGQTDRGWTRLFRGQDTQRTSTEMTVEGTDRRTQENILLDLSQIDRDETQNVRVTVRVTDEVSGATVTRELDFTLEPNGTP